MERMERDVSERAKGQAQMKRTIETLHQKINITLYSHKPLPLKLRSQYIYMGHYSSWGVGVCTQKKMKPP